MNYHRLSDADLDRYIADLESQVDEDGYEPEELSGALEERHLRDECASDHRVAQAFGLNFGDRPS